MKFFLVLFCTFLCSLSLFAQIELSVKDKQTKEAISYAQVQIQKKSISNYITDNYGGVIINGIKLNDTVKVKISASGYQPIDSSILISDLKFSLLLDKVFQTLDTVTVKTRNVTLQSDRVVYQFSNYVKKETEMTADVISRLPGIIKSSATEFKTVGNKTLKVYLDGRLLLPVEVAAIPAAIIAKAELVVLPAVNQEGESQSVLYLSSLMNVPNYSFTLLSGGYDVGVYGPSLQINRSTKSKNWNTNFLVNYYKRTSKSESSITDKIINNTQFDTVKSNTAALIYMYSATRVFSKDDLFTLGSVGNLAFANVESKTGVFNTSKSEFLNTQYNHQTLPFTFFATWSKKLNIGKLSLSGVYDYNITNQKYKQQNDISQQDEFSSTNKSNTNVTSVSSSLTFNNKKISGGAFSNSIAMGVALSNTAIDILTKVNTNQHSLHKDQRFYLGYNTGYSKKAWKYNLNLLYNFRIRDNNGIAYQQSYLYPKIVISKKLNSRNSLALSASNQTYQPAPKMLVTDTFYTNNWLEKIGNENLKTERMYKTELLHTFNGDKLFSQTILSYTFRKNAIVTGKIRTNTNGYLQNYFNQDYGVWLLSNSSQFTFSDKFSISSLLNLSNTKYHTAVPADFKSLYAIDGNLNANIELLKGTFTTAFTYETVSLGYLRKTYKYPDISFYYAKDLKPFLNLTITAGNLFDLSGKTKMEENMGIVFKNLNHQRTIGLSLIWTIGKRFPLLSAGDGSKIANDIKN